MATRPQTPSPVYATELGRLYEADCMEILPGIEEGSIDTIFADPPFNLSKDYGKNFRIS
jgi:site-specific DNA-methyltransferase (adenine-specific)